MGTNESITKELRSVTAERGVILVEAHEPTVVISESERNTIADRIDERCSRELTAKQDEVDGLRAKLDASILPPLDADGAPWTGEDVDGPFDRRDGREPDPKMLREIAFDWPHAGWWLVDGFGTHYPADKCHHVKQEPPETIEDVRRTIGRGYGRRAVMSDHEKMCDEARARMAFERSISGVHPGLVNLYMQSLVQRFGPIPDNPRDAYRRGLADLIAYVRWAGERA